MPSPSNELTTIEVLKKLTLPFKHTNKERGAFALNGQCEQVTTLGRGGDYSPTLEGLERRVTIPSLLQWGSVRVRVGAATVALLLSKG